MHLLPSRGLLLLWLCFLVRGFFYSYSLPLWEGFDEFSHFAYVQHLRHHGALPLPNIDRMSYEVNSSLRAYPVPWTQRELHPNLLSYEQFAALSPEARAARLGLLNSSPEPDPAAETIYEAQQPPLYYLVQLPVLAVGEQLRLELPQRVLLLRAFSILLASLALPLGFLLARRFLPELLALALCAAITTLPGLFIDIARVGNDALAIPIYTALAYLLQRVYDGGAGWRLHVSLGLVLGAGLLTKSYFLTALPVVVVVYLYRRSWLGLGLSVLTSLACSAWWYGFILKTTGDLTGQIQSAHLKAIPLSTKLSTALHLNWLRALDTALLSHLWFGGWSFLQLKSWAYHLFYLLFAAALAGLLLAAIRRRLHPLGPLLALELAFCLSLAYHVVLGQLGYGAPMTNGWYLFCLIFPQFLLMATGLSQWMDQKYTPALLAVAFFLLEAYGFNFLQLPYYRGLLAHLPNGRLPLLPMSRLPELFSLSWCVFLAASLVAPLLALRAARAKD